MGAMNVQLAMTNWRNLPRDAYVALLWMCLRAYDEGKERGVDPPYHYWAGPRLLAYAMGATSSEDELLTPVVEQRVRRAVHTLIDEGAITLIERGNGRHASVYRVNVKPSDVVPRAVDNNSRSRSQPGDNSARAPSRAKGNES